MNSPAERLRRFLDDVRRVKAQQDAELARLEHDIDPDEVAAAGHEFARALDAQGESATVAARPKSISNPTPSGPAFVPTFARRA